jgi:hypothetical protein
VRTARTHGTQKIAPRTWVTTPPQRWPRVGGTPRPGRRRWSPSRRPPDTRRHRSPPPHPLRPRHRWQVAAPCDLHVGESREAREANLRWRACPPTRVTRHATYLHPCRSSRPFGGRRGCGVAVAHARVGGRGGTVGQAGACGSGSAACGGASGSRGVAHGDRGGSVGGAGDAARAGTCASACPCVRACGWRGSGERRGGWWRGCGERRGGWRCGCGERWCASARTGSSSRGEAGGEGGWGRWRQRRREALTGCKRCNAVVNPPPPPSPAAARGGRRCHARLLRLPLPHAPRSMRR